MMIPAIIGARIYYGCIFMDAYKDNIPEIFNLRHGGLGIIGGVIMAIIVLLIFGKGKKAECTFNAWYNDNGTSAGSDYGTMGELL